MNKYRLGCCAIVLIVLLRIGIGWHFLYEGVHKFDPAKGFTSEGFLGIAKGPTKELYYWMLPDLDGIQRVELGTVKDENDKEFDTFIVYEDAWKEYFDNYKATFPKEPWEPTGFLWKEYVETNPDALKEHLEANPNALKDYTEQNPGMKELDAKIEVAKSALDAKDVFKWKAQAIFDQYLGSLRESATDTKQDLEAFLKSRERFLEMRQNIRNTATFEQERRWNLMFFYRAQAAGWTRMLEAKGNSLQSELGRLADPELAGQRGEIITAPEKELFPPNDFISMPVPAINLSIPPKNPYVKSYDLSIQSRMQAMDAAVMIALSAIGLCMVLGFCTRLACLGGAAFLVNVVLTTFPVPGIYPETPSMVGNFMGVSKDVVELLAILFLAAVPSGRWGGLDYFLWHYGGKQIAGLFIDENNENTNV